MGGRERELEREAGVGRGREGEGVGREHSGSRESPEIQGEP